MQSVSPNPLRFRWTIHENFCVSQNGHTFKPYIVYTLLTTTDVSNDMIVSVQLVAYAADSLKVKFQNHPTPNKQGHSHPQYLDIWRLMHAVWNQVGWELTLKMSHRVLRWLSCYAFLHIVFFFQLFFSNAEVLFTLKLTPSTTSTMHSWLSQVICRQPNINMMEQFECKAISWMELVRFHTGDVGKKMT